MTALGRQEEWEDSPEGYPQTPPYQWWNWNDGFTDTQSSHWWSDRQEGDVDPSDPRPRRSDSKGGDAR
jgi:hypothetical protein